MKAVALLLLGCLALAGCSQVSALAPVSGDRITTLTTAATTVLLERSVPILVAPRCVEMPASPASFSCAGRTIDGQPISVTGGGTPLVMTVSVGATELYRGDVQTVIERAAEAGR